MPRTRAVAARDAFARIEAGKIGPAWLLIGDNTLLVDEIIAALRSHVVDPAFEAFDYESWLADDTSPEAFEQHVRQVAMGSGRRLVVIRNITRPGTKGPAWAQRLGAAGVERILAVLAAAPPDNCAVLVGIAKKELDTALRRHGLSEAVVAVDQPDAASLAALARRWAGENGLALDPDAARLLVETVGGDAAIVKSETDKLAAAFPPGTAVSVAEVRALAAGSREFTLAEYIDRFLRRDAAGALAVLRRLETWGNPRELVPGIIAWLANAFIDLAALRSGAGGPSWRVRDCARYWPNLTEINRFLQSLYRINRDLVTGRPGTLTRLATLTACTACRGDSGYCDARTASRPFGSRTAALGRAFDPALCLVPRPRPTARQ